MGKRTLNKEEIWQLVWGASALATGGGGSCPTYEQFSAQADTFLKEGREPILIDPTDIKDDDIVFCNIGCGGGIRFEESALYPRYTPRTGLLKQIDLTRGINSWSKLPEFGRGETHLEKLAELIGKKPVAYTPFECGPLDSGQLYACARRGLPLVDEDLAGYRAVPELSLTKLNVFDAPVAPYTIATSWGDLIVGHTIFSHQRFEDIGRYIAVISGGSSSPAYAMTGKYLKMGKTHNTMSLAIKVGKAMLEAKDKGDDPVDVLVEVTNGFKIFEGKVAGYMTEAKMGFNWGNAWIEGTGDYEGKTFKLWFKNENQISWIDEEPYVTCPDPFTVIDKKTGLGLSNFRSDWWTPGREVAVCALKAADHWRTKRGLNIYRPKHFGFDIKYVPVEKKLG
jgi:hypothetical protein